MHSRVAACAVVENVSFGDHSPDPAEVRNFAEKLRTELRSTNPPVRARVHATCHTDAARGQAHTSHCMPMPSAHHHARAHLSAHVALQDAWQKAPKRKSAPDRKQPSKLKRAAEKPGKSSHMFSSLRACARVPAVLAPCFQCSWTSTVGPPRSRVRALGQSCQLLLTPSLMPTPQMNGVRW